MQRLPQVMARRRKQLPLRAIRRLCCGARLVRARVWLLSSLMRSEFS